MPNPTAEQFLSLLRSNLGLGEDPPGSNCNVISHAILGYCDQWCAATIKWGAVELGADPDLVMPGWSGYCPTWEYNLRANGDWFEPNEIAQVRPGFVAMVDWYGTQESWHVFAVDEISLEGVWALEGNRHDLLQRSLYTSMIRGFGRLHWSEAAALPVQLPKLTPPPAEECMAQMTSKSGKALDTDHFLADAYAGDDADEWIGIHDENEDPAGNHVTIYITLDDGTGSAGEHKIEFTIPGNYRRAAVCVNRISDHTPGITPVGPDEDMTRHQGFSVHVEASQPVTAGRSRYPRKVEAVV